MSALPPDRPVLDELIAAAGRPPVSEMDVRRLRRAVRRGVAGERRQAPRAPRAAWAVAVAAGLAVVAAGFVLRGGPEGGAAAETSAQASFSRTADGEVRIFFADQRPVHTVRKRLLTASGAAGLAGQETIRTVQGREYVDRNGQAVPGTVVMYVID